MPKALVEFARQQREAKRPPCRVCALKPAVRTEIAQSDRSVINFATIIEWLKREHSVTLTIQELQAHARARHDASDTR